MKNRLASLASTLFLVLVGLFLVVLVIRSASRRHLVRPEKIKAFDLAFNLGADYA